MEALIAAEAQVGTPAWHSRLRTPGCHSCGLGGSRVLDSIPGLERPYAVDAGEKKRERERKKDTLEPLVWLDTKVRLHNVD